MLTVLRSAISSVSLLLAATALTLITFPASAAAQASGIAAMRPMVQANRVPAGADFGPQTRLSGHIPSWATASNQVSRSVNLGAPLHVSIVLSRDPAVQAAFLKFLSDQQTPGSPVYHQWLTPPQVGTLFGPTASDLAAVTNWLTSQGLTVDSVAPSQAILEVSGSTAAIASAFRTSFGYFSLDGTPRLSAVSEPSIPTALAPVILAVNGLVEAPLQPTSYHAGPHQPPNAAALNPEFTNTGSSGTSYFLTPNDFAVIYDVNSVYTGGNKGATLGTGLNHVAIIGRSRVSATDISEFATNTAIANYNLNTIIPTNGTDPGAVCTFANAATCATGGDQGEQTLDVDRVIGTAPGVQADLVVSLSSQTTDGVYIAASYNVNTLVDKIMTISYGGCETNNGSSGVNLYNTLYSAGAAEGISTFVSSGDSGANACAKAFTTNTIAYAASINALCSSTFVTCVGGTEFNDASSYSTYWSATNGTGMESAKSYIPEGGWNESVTAAGIQVAASGGGPSVYITKPIWQTGTDGARDTPDIAYPAASHDGYYACLDFELGLYASQGITSSDNCTSAGGGYFFGFSGTSAAAPAAAGVTALLLTRLGLAQGNLNPLLYKLAAGASSPFHDITVATSGVTSCVVTSPSMCNNSTPAGTTTTTTGTGGVQGFLLTSGYDEVTGLGSLDVANFLTAAANVVAPVTTTLAVTATPNPGTANSAVILKATLTPGTSTYTPTGTVQFYSNNVAIGAAVTLSSNTASLSYTFPTAGTYSITAVYSGDANFATSTAPGYSLVINSGPTFSVTPTVTAITLTSGATTGNTDGITLASLNSFSGGVTLTCTVTNASGTAAGTCGVMPGSVTLTAGGNGSATLTVNTTPGTSGALNVTVTGTSGTTVVTSTNILVTITASSFTAAAVPTTLNLTSGATTGNTSVVTFTSVNGFAGTVAVTCVATKTSGNAAGTCVASPASVTLAANGTATTTVTLTSTAGTAGALSLVVTGTGAPTGGTIAATASTTITANLVTPTFNLAATPATITAISGATTGNTSVVTFTSANGFAGPVAVTCTAANTSGTAAGSCAASPATVTLTAGGMGTTTITLTSTPGTSGTLSLSVMGTSGAVSASLATPIVATLTASSFTMAATTPAAVTSGTAASSTVTFTSVNGFAGTVSPINCTISTGSAAFPPTCAVAPTSVSLTSGGTATAVVTVSSTTAQAGITPQHASVLGFGLKGGVLLAGLLCLLPFGRRRALRTLAAFSFLAIGLASLSGCSGGGTPPTTPKSSAGMYTITVNASGTTTGATAAYSTSTTFTLTIN